MAGPTTEVLNEDIRTLRDEVHGADLDVRELSTKVGGIILTVQVLGVFTLASLLSGVWWGASLTTKVDGLGTRFDKLEARSDKLEAKVDAIDTRLDKLEAKADAHFEKIEARFDKIDARFDRLEASIARLIEQSRPAVKP